MEGMFSLKFWLLNLGSNKVVVVVVIGVVSFYTDFLESLYEQMGETASITGKNGCSFFMIFNC